MREQAERACLLLPSHRLQACWNMENLFIIMLKNNIIYLHLLLISQRLSRSLSLQYISRQLLLGHGFKFTSYKRTLNMSLSPINHDCINICIFEEEWVNNLVWSDTATNNGFYDFDYSWVFNTPICLFIKPLTRKCAS